MKKVKLIGYLLVSSLLVGCGGGSSSSSSPTNVAPEAEDALFSLNENQDKEIVLQARDEDGNTLTYEIIVAPQHGTFENGLYRPDTDYVGRDSFTFVANDGVSNSAPATVTIIITADFDGDNISDAIDMDDDNDGVLDELDAFPFDANESIDTDGDGIGNNADLDDDGDGVNDIEDVFPLDRSVSVDTDEDTAEDEVVDEVDTDGNSTTTPALPLIVSISGKVEYERVNPIHSGIWSRLDTSNITTEVAKEVIVEAIDSSGNTIASTSTDSNGEYVLGDIPSEIEVKVRVYAKMFKENKWDVKVVDNTNANAQYVIEGELRTTGTSNAIRNLKATVDTKSSPPFAILDSIYLAMKKVEDTDSQAVFPLLYMNWSVNNVESGTYYDGNETIMLQGDQNGDSDEYDDHIIVHEWGHYFEEKFSRADSIGGGHSGGDFLDIRVAFGEGWGNAWSAIATDDPIYFDTMGNSGWNMNIESATQINPGWFSEISIQRILYDLYDSNDDDADVLSLGFKPLYDVLVGAQKVTPAFTSIFSFITALKDENADVRGEIDSIVSFENIAIIKDIYGVDRTNRSDAYPYHALALESSTVNIQTSSRDGSYNKLSNHQYVKFSINTRGKYSINVEQTNGSSSDPDFLLYASSPFKLITIGESYTEGSETLSVVLEEGEYMLDISDYKNISIAEYTVAITLE